MAATVAAATPLDMHQLTDFFSQISFHLHINTIKWLVNCSWESDKWIRVCNTTTHLICISQYRHCHNTKPLYENCYVLVSQSTSDIVFSNNNNKNRMVMDTHVYSRIGHLLKAFVWKYHRPPPGWGWWIWKIGRDCQKMWKKDKRFPLDFH